VFCINPAAGAVPLFQPRRREAKPVHGVDHSVTMSDARSHFPQFPRPFAVSPMTIPI